MARRVMHEFASGYTPDEGAVDLPRLRRAFSELMERAAHAVLCDGYDLDDAEFERLIVCRYAGQAATRVIAAESLTDAERLFAPFHAAAAPPGAEPGPAGEVEIVGLRVQVVADPDMPFGGSYGRGD